MSEADGKARPLHTLLTSRSWHRSQGDGLLFVQAGRQACVVGNPTSRPAQGSLSKPEDNSHRGFNTDWAMSRIKKWNGTPDRSSDSL